MSMYIRTDLEGKVNNLPDFKNEALLPVFEAVANSIQAIEEIGDLSKGKIIIRINRDKLSDLLDSKSDKPITGFEIEDNGIGFNDNNFESFKTAESTYKLSKGGKGIGRFFWLKAFDRIEIESVYGEGKNKKQRIIYFTKTKAIEEKNNKISDSPRRTTVKLIDFKKDYRNQSSAFKTAKKIAQRIFEHCLSYYIAKNAPTITVKDTIDNAEFNLNSMYEEIKNDISQENIKISKEAFSITHIKLYSTYKNMHNIVLCANSRDVLSIDIGKILGTSTQFDGEEKKFIYAAYVSSPYLDKCVDAVRNSFDIPETRNELYTMDSSVTMDELKSNIIEKAKAFLSIYLENIKKRKEETVARYISHENPMLRSVPHYCPEIFNEIELNSSEEKINEVLYKHKGRAEYKIRRQAENLLKTQVDSIEEIREEYDKITNELKDVQKDQLAGYVVYRKMIIELLDKKLQLNKDGKYPNENIIHDILFPRKCNTGQLGSEDYNLWLIDERLTFHSFATSDTEFSRFSNSPSDDRPDILVFSELDSDRIAKAVSIIELKKPQRKTFDEDPVGQIFGYIRKAKDSKIKLPNGRDLKVDDTTRFYCYGICDINDKIKEFAENGDYAELKNGLGYYTYNSKLKAHIELLSFDKIIVDAKQRHKAFFDKLGI